MSDAEKWYDEEIAPALLAIGKRCEDRGVAMVATVEYAPGERGSTMCLPNGAGLEMQMLRLCANAGRNVDGYLMAVTRFCNANDIDTSSSIFLSRFGPTYSTGDEGTCSPAGPGALIDCMKCSACGWSVTPSDQQGGRT